MKNNKITITYTEDKGFNISTSSNNIPMCYAELSSFMYDIAAAMAKFDREANNEIKENIQMSESDEKQNALKIRGLALAQARVVNFAKALMKSDEPIEEGMRNFFRILTIPAFSIGWDYCLEFYDSVEGKIKEEEE